MNRSAHRVDRKAAPGIIRSNGIGWTSRLKRVYAEVRKQNKKKKKRELKVITREKYCFYKRTNPYVVEHWQYVFLLISFIRIFFFVHKCIYF